MSGQPVAKTCKREGLCGVSAHHSCGGSVVTVVIMNALLVGNEGDFVGWRSEVGVSVNHFLFTWGGFKYVCYLICLCETRLLENPRISQSNSKNIEATPPK